MSPAAFRDEAPSSSSACEPEFARGAEGFPVARLDDLVLAMLPRRDGGWSLASAWRVGRPLDELTRSDFTIFESGLADEAAFRARVHETAEHRRELRGLDRRQARMSLATPWGSSQVATVYADGVVSHSTASHGGFHLTPERNAKVPSSLRAADGWYEEDCAWTAVAIAFPPPVIGDGGCSGARNASRGSGCLQSGKAAAGVGHWKAVSPCVAL